MATRSREGRPSVRAGKVGTKAPEPAAPYAVPSGESRHGVEPGLQPLGNTAPEPAGAVDNSLSMDRAAVCMASGTDRRRSVSCYRKGASFDSSTAARSAIAVGCICGLETPRAGFPAAPSRRGSPRCRFPFRRPAALAGRLRRSLPAAVLLALATLVPVLPSSSAQAQEVVEVPRGWPLKPSHGDAAELVDGFIEAIAERLSAGEEVKISSFGSFTVRDQGARMGRNPKTGEPAAILPRRVVVFRPSAKLKERINEMLGDAGEDA